MTAVVAALTLGLMTTSGAKNAPRELPAKLRSAQVDTLSFDALAGWKDDDHAEAFGAFMKSCRAILNGTPAMRKARPVYGGLFEACERAKAAGTLDGEQARVLLFGPGRSPPLAIPRSSLDWHR